MGRRLRAAGLLGFGLLAGCIVFSAEDDPTPTTTPTPVLSPTASPSPTRTGTPGPTPTPTPLPGDTNVVVFTKPVADIAVFVTDTEGALVATEHTAADGTVSILVPGGGSVSVAQPASGSDTVVLTFVAPPTGAAIVVNNGDPSEPTPTPTPSPTPTPPNSTLDVDFLNLPVNASTIQWRHTCSGMTTIAATPNVTQSASHCTQTSWSVVAIVRDATGASISWGETSGVPLNPGATVSIDVDVSDTAFESAMLSHGTLPGPSAAQFFLSAVESFGQFSDFLNFTTTAAPVSKTLSLPQSIVSGRSAGMRLTYTGLSGHNLAYWRTWTVGSAFDAVYSLDPAEFPAMAVGVLDDSDPAHPALSWTGDGYGDWGTASIRWTNPGNGARGYWNWIVPPSGVTTVSVPQIPGYTPNAASIFDARGVFYTDREEIDGYEELLGDDPYTGIYGLYTSVRDDVPY